MHARHATRPQRVKDLPIATALGVALEVNAARERVAAEIHAHHTIWAHLRERRRERARVGRCHVCQRGRRAALAIARNDEEQRRALGAARQALLDARRAIRAIGRLQRHHLSRTTPQVWSQLHKVFRHRSWRDAISKDDGGARLGYLLPRLCHSERAQDVAATTHANYETALRRLEHW
jgi:hypothetical protein